MLRIAASVLLTSAALVALHDLIDGGMWLQLFLLAGSAFGFGALCMFQTCRSD